MKLDGKAIAAKMYDELQFQVRELKDRGVVPTLAVILVGNNPASVAYINQKKKFALQIGANVIVYHFDEKVGKREVEELIQKLNNSEQTHGIIIQLPLPEQLNSRKLLNLINPKKDVDGLQEESEFTFPLASAVLKILEHIYSVIARSEATRQSHEALYKSHGIPDLPFVTTSRNRQVRDDNNSFRNWLFAQTIAILGKGEAGGKPVAEILNKFNGHIMVIDSKTENPYILTQKANIVISAVGKDILEAENLKGGAIVIGVGQRRGEDNKLHGDFNEEEIAKVSSFYTPTPGGVGAVNVACLLENLVEAAEQAHPLDK